MKAFIVVALIVVFAAVALSDEEKRFVSFYVLAEYMYIL
jgi:hypothetical protein